VFHCLLSFCNLASDVTLYLHNNNNNNNMPTALVVIAGDFNSLSDDDFVSRTALTSLVTWCELSG